MSGCIALDEDFHVHSTFSDDATSTVAENVNVARERGLRTLCLTDHVRRDTAWVPDFVAAVAEHRHEPGLRVLAGVEAKVLDTSGQLDVPAGLDDGIDLVLVADHQFPADNGPLHPAEVRAAIEYGAMTAGEAIERLCTATANAIAPGRPLLLAHLFSLLPKIGLTEEMVPMPLLADLAARAARADVLVEVNEKWSCPSVRTTAAMADAGVHLVAGSDSHHCTQIGAYAGVRRTADAVPRALPGES
jgi:putative hydrolase